MDLDRLMPLGLDLPSALHTSSSTFRPLLNVTFIRERLSERDHLPPR